MTRYAFILGLITTGVIVSGFFPVLLPVGITNALNMVIGSMWSWNGLIPVATIFYAFSFYLFIELALLSYIIFKWIVGN
jgi:hypothetical protein